MSKIWSVDDLEVRVLQRADLKALKKFSCSLGLPPEQEVEAQVRGPLPLRYLGVPDAEHDPRMIVCFDPDKEILAVGAHHVEAMPVRKRDSEEVIDIRPTYLEVVAVSVDARRTTVDHGDGEPPQRFGHFMFDTLINDIRARPNRTPMVFGRIHKDHGEALREAGFPADLSAGDTVLPAVKGNVSKFNAEGGEIVHKDQPKETAYRQQEWTWTEFRGRYDRVERSKIVDVPYKRYPRTPIPPPSIELIAAEDVSGELVVITPPLDYTDANAEALLHRVNLLRELFGEAKLLTEDLAPFDNLKLRRLNWEVLPVGERPWPQLRRRLDPILRNFGERSGPAVEQRLKILTEDHSPDFSAVGRAGFHGYIIFGFNERGSTCWRAWNTATPPTSSVRTGRRCRR